MRYSILTVLVLTACGSAPSNLTADDVANDVANDANALLAAATTDVENALQYCPTLNAAAPQDYSWPASSPNTIPENANVKVDTGWVYGTGITDGTGLPADTNARVQVWEIPRLASDIAAGHVGVVGWLQITVQTGQGTTESIGHCPAPAPIGDGNFLRVNELNGPGGFLYINVQDANGNPEGVLGTSAECNF